MSSLYENYNSGNDDNTGIGNTSWRAQTFLVGGTEHTVTSIKLYISKIGSPTGDFLVSVRAVDGSNKPTGSNLTSGTTDVSTLPTSPTQEWREVSLTEYTLEANTTYAVVLNFPNGDGSNYVYWAVTNDPGGYADGKLWFSTDSGSSWSDLAGDGDGLFEVWGNVALNFASINLEKDSSQYAYITDVNQTGLDLNSDFTLECWIKFESLPTGTDGYAFISKWESNKCYSFDYYANSGSPLLRLSVSDNGATAPTVSVSWSPVVDTWYHIAVAYDKSAGEATFYVDGTQQGTTQSGLDISVFVGDVPFIIGQVETIWFFDGLIDEARAWGIKRTLTEINDNKDVELIGTELHLKGYWQFNNDYLDQTSNNNDLTAVNSPVFFSDVPFTGGTTTSSSTSSSTTTTSSSTTTTLDPQEGGLAFGEQNPTEGETEIAWNTFSDGVGGLVDVEGNPLWGKMKLNFNEQGRSNVYSYGNSMLRTYIVTRNRYGTGQGTATSYIRGSTTKFNQDDVLPVWEIYLVPIEKNWKFIQVREVNT